MKFVFHLLVSCFFLSISACSSHKQMEKSTVAAENDNKLLFLILHLQSDSSDKIIDAKLVNKIITTGTIKGNAGKSPISNDQIVLQVNARNKVIQQLFFQNPLMQHLEYGDETGNLQFKDIVLHEVDFTARLALPTEAVNIEIYHQKEKKLILIYKLNL